MFDITSPDIFDNLPVTAFFTGKMTNIDFGKMNSLSINIPVLHYLPIQKHTNNVIIIDNDLTPKEADAVITQNPNILIGARTADCVPILLYDKKKSVIAAVHAGWRGTALSILKNSISTLIDKFHSNPLDIIIAIGPSIKYCCYKVGQEVIDAVILATGNGEYYKQENGDLYINLAEANRLQALSLGVSDNNIWLSTDCAYCKSDTYFSYRKSPEILGRQGGFICLRP